MNEPSGAEPKVALVVGGSGDIGRSVAHRLGQLGYRLAVTGLRQDRVDAAVDELTVSGLDARGFAVDLEDSTAIDALFDALGKDYGRLDVLVNAAGVARPRPFLRTDAEHFEETLRVNLVGPALVGRRALMMMRKARSGAIINVTSLGGHVGRKGFGAYCASKGGLMALSDSLRQEAERYGVRVATICPDEVDTQMHGDAPERGAMISPTDVAEAVAFLLRLSSTAVVREVRIYNTGG